MNNLFSVFDPQVGWLGLRINWIRILLVTFWIPRIFWVVKSQTSFLLVNLLVTLRNEFKNNFSPLVTPGHTHWAVSIFLIILLNNVGGLTPYTFTRTSHLSISIRLALTGWLSYWLARVLFDLGRALAHLVPVGTPYILMPFIVLIELTSRIIRPLTLSVRLAANIVAGHLLITLIRSPAVTRNFRAAIFILIGLSLLFILETAVAFIQAYVFRILRTLYLREANSLNLHYLRNFKN